MSIPKVDVEVGQVILEGELDMEGKLRAEGDYTILGYTLGHSESELLFKGATQYITSSIDVSTMVGPGILPILIEGAGEVFLQWKPSKFFSGWLMVGLWFPVPDWLDWLIKEDPYYISSTYAGIDEDGFHFRFKILKLTFSFDVKPKWLNSSAPMQISLKNDETGVISKVSAAKAKPTFRVGGNVPTELIAFQGKNSEPEVVLTRPDGMVLDSTMDPSDMPDNVTCVVDDDNRTVGFLIKRPMAGEWKIDIKNLDVCGNVNTHQLHGNNEPEAYQKRSRKQLKGSIPFHIRPLIKMIRQIWSSTSVRTIQATAVF